ncbi:MAG: MrcB family domain-containing protein [Ignavibacteriales bacterium]
MALPSSLSGIFKQKQRTYKMVLILSLLEEMWTSETLIPTERIADRFLTFYLDREVQGKKVEAPPKDKASSWQEMTLGKVTRLLFENPIPALDSVIMTDPQKQWVGFRPDILEELNSKTREELKQYSLEQIEEFYESYKRFSLKNHLTYILSNYVKAKSELFKEHPLGVLVRQQIPKDLQSLSFIGDQYRVQGSVGQGNWANIPWIAIMDKRITSSTQHGEYVVYLFAEDMSSVYLTLAQGVTLPREKGKKEGYEYLKQKVQEIRRLVPLKSFQKDDQIYLTNSGLGKDYQVSTVAYVRYDLPNMPSDDQLFADLEEMIENYQSYLEATQSGAETSGISFKYTMAYLHYIQGLIHYLGDNYTVNVSIDELIANQSLVLKKGDDVKHPKERIQHLARAAEELGLIKRQDSYYGLTELGYQYYQCFQRDNDFWVFEPNQIQIIRHQIHAMGQDKSNLCHVMEFAVNLAKQFQKFTIDAFRDPFISGMTLEQEWGEVTQNNRAKFMLNWLQELQYITKSGDIYLYLDDEEENSMEHVANINEKLQWIKHYILSKGFHYPDHLIENFYLSLKTKPFVILAGISGTGKTKLVKLFAEALGAKMELIPVRPDWSDPSDLLGYRDLSGQFRKGRLTEVLLEAADPQNKDKIYFICLDEMNLARVEHYFSDILSIMETEKWSGDQIVTDSIISGESDLNDVYIPENVYLIGTVNMDETTHPFSKKVLDRAHTIEFNYINLNTFPEEFMNQLIPVPVANSFLKRDYLTLKDAYSSYAPLIQRTTERLIEINKILENIHSHIGFRVRDSICFYLIYNERFGLLSEEAALDLQILQKILPRIQGSSFSVKRVLIELMLLATGQRRNVDEMMNDPSVLYSNIESARYHQSARKLAYMLRRVEEDGFTSFWLS